MNGKQAFQLACWALLSGVLLSACSVKVLSKRTHGSDIDVTNDFSQYNTAYSQAVLDWATYKNKYDTEHFWTFINRYAQLEREGQDTGDLSFLDLHLNAGSDHYFYMSASPFESYNKYLAKQWFCKMLPKMWNLGVDHNIKVPQNMILYSWQDTPPNYDSSKKIWIVSNVQDKINKDKDNGLPYYTLIGTVNIASDGRIESSEPECK